MLVTTLDRMARGGLMDQLAGGFHRYSTDEAWLVPHFEKMLYDNASLAWLYAEASALAPGAGFDRVARFTLDFVLREMTASRGRLPLGDRRRDGRARGRLLHVDGRGARGRPARRRGAPLPRGVRPRGTAAVRGRALRAVPAQLPSPSRRARAGSRKPS